MAPGFRVSGRIAALQLVLLVSQVFVAPFPALAQKGLTTYDPVRPYDVSVSPRAVADGLITVTHVAGTQPGSTRIGQDAPRTTTGGQETVGVSGGPFVYGPCSFVEGAGQNWWQTAVNRYSYGLVPCAPYASS